LADPGFVARERRVFLLPVYVAACVAVGDDQAAADGLAQLEELARRFGTAGPAASAAVARGRVSLHRGDTEAAIAALQDGVRIWNEIEAPYEAAQTRVLLARALTAEGDSAGARLELKAAARLVEEFGVAVDLNIRALDGSGVPLAARELGLTARELEVLALVSEGRTNRQIADSLYIAVKTASAHVSSLLLKLGVANRSEAGAAARRLDLN
jgi:DNA-binding NarL/FixJ family response regulator